MHRANKEIKLPRIPFLAALMICLMLFSLLVAGLCWALLPIDDTNRQEYQRILLQANPALGGNNTKTPYTAVQERQGISKDYFFNRDGQRLHLHLDSDSALLQLEQQSDRTFLVEHMQDVSCQVQEELFYNLADGRQAVLLPNGQLALRNDSKRLLSESESQMAVPMQLVRYFKADKATYHYANGQLEAENTMLFRYLTKGHTLPRDTPEPSDSDIHGMAKKLQLSLVNGDLNFKAVGFKALFQECHGDKR